MLFVELYWHVVITVFTLVLALRIFVLSPLASSPIAADFSDSDWNIRGKW